MTARDILSDRIAADLKLYIDNDGDLYRRQYVPILKNLATKKARGIYKHGLAVKLFGYLVEAGAKKYASTYGSPGQLWHKMFDVPTRRLVAEELTKDFEGEYATGNYDHLLPKKYQKPETAPRTSRAHAKKSADLHTRLHDPGALRAATDRQLRGFYREEKRDVAKARAEAARRGLPLHAKRRAQLDREISELVPSWRGGR